MIQTVRKTKSMAMEQDQGQRRGHLLHAINMAISGQVLPEEARDQGQVGQVLPEEARDHGQVGLVLPEEVRDLNVAGPVIPGEVTILDLHLHFRQAKVDPGMARVSGGHSILMVEELYS